MERRNFVRRSGLTALGALLGADIVFGNTLPEGLQLLGLQDPDPFKMFDKDPQMVVLNDKPWNMEALAHLLDDAVTPNRFMFIRNNGKIPENIDAGAWTLAFDGEAVRQPKSYSLAELKSRFRAHTYQLTLECGGNGRSEFDPPAKGNQWTVGAVSSAEWTGVRLRDLLDDVGITDRAVYVGYHAADTHLSGDLSKEPISRGIPIQKALQDETLVAFQMNGKDIPLAHGYPLRLVAGLYLRQVAHPPEHPRPCTRRRKDDRRLLPGTLYPGGTRYHRRRRRHVHYRIHARKIPCYLSKDRSNAAAGPQPFVPGACMGRGTGGFRGPLFHRFRKYLEAL